MCTFPQPHQRVGFHKEASAAPERVQVVGANDDLDKLLDDLRGRRELFHALNLAFSNDEIVGTRIELEEFGVHGPDPGVAVIAVPPGRDPVRVAHLLQVDLLGLRRNIVAEPSYVASVAAALPPWRLDPPLAKPGRLAQAVQDVTLRFPPRAWRTVAVVDTGTTDRTTPMYDLTTATPGLASPTDFCGHGTAMQDLIRQVNPSARVVAVRVLQWDQGEAWPTIAALIALVWGKVVTPDVISMSLAFPSLNSCETGLGATLAWLLGQAPPNHHWPPLVIAAGNQGPGVLPYPAAMPAPGAIVIGAWDWTSRPARYSGPADQGNSLRWAFGGEDGDPVAQATNGSTTRSLFGTSIATALVAGALSR